MVRCCWPLALLAVGCVGQETAPQLVPGNLFSPPAVVQQASHTSYTQASQEAATRVALVGQKVLAANPQLGLRPTFSTIGSPKPEIFHRGPTQVFVTEGLVRQCEDEALLAALLCQELGKMVAEREAGRTPESRGPSREPPPQMRIGNDSGSSFGSPDLTYMAELAPYDKERRRAMTAPDPQVVARSLMEKAGYTATDLEAAAPLLREAAANSTWEKQIVAPNRNSQPWTQKTP